MIWIFFNFCQYFAKFLSNYDSDDQYLPSRHVANRILIITELNLTYQDPSNGLKTCCRFDIKERLKILSLTAEPLNTER